MNKLKVVVFGTLPLSTKVCELLIRNSKIELTLPEIAAIFVFKYHLSEINMNVEDPEGNTFNLNDLVFVKPTPEGLGFLESDSKYLQNVYNIAPIESMKPDEEGWVELQIHNLITLMDNPWISSISNASMLPIEDVFVFRS